ncbi:MAG: histidine kinase [Flavobacteriaceae bacterium]|jgi:sensor histidine kinase YesM|nr:histidine kinase [Flavobacteriaceae bacterium]
MNAVNRLNLSRLLLNIFFAGLVILVSINNNKNNLYIGYILLYNIVLFVPAWVNNFYLFPKLRIHKNILRYLLEAVVLLLIAILTAGTYLRWLYHYFERSELTDFTALAINASVSSSLESYQSYFDVLPGIILLMLSMAIGYVLQEYLLKLKREESIEAQQNIAELALLKSQISPHFLFNILNSLYALSLKEDKETPNVILKLSDILRYSLYESQEREISITEEIHILQTYFAIEQLRIPSNASVSFQHDGIKDSIKIVPMLLLPLIENAFKHGIDSTIGNSYIEANLSCDDKRLIFECKNSFKEQPTKAIGGIGIENISKRLQLLYPSKHSLQINKSADTFSITLEIKI